MADSELDRAPEAMDAPTEGPVAEAIRAELDQVLPHVVTALKRQDAVEELRHRLDLAEKRLAERQQRPFVAGVRRVLVMVRRLDFEQDAKEAIAAELERVLVGAGYAEFGEEGEAFDPRRHEVVDGSGDEQSGVTVIEVLEPGLETLGEIVVRTKVRVGEAEEE